MKRKYTNQCQFEMLVEFLERNPHIARAQLFSPNGRIEADNLWKQETIKLNSFGPPEHDTNGWKRVWKDFKCKTRVKVHNNNKNLGTTSGRILHMTQLERRIANVLRPVDYPEKELEEHINIKEEEEESEGEYSEIYLDASVDTDGNDCDDSIVLNETAESEEETEKPVKFSYVTIPEPPVVKLKPYDKTDLLNEQLQIQKDYHKMMESKMNEIIEIKKRRLNLEEAKFKLMKRNIKHGNKSVI